MNISCSKSVFRTFKWICRNPIHLTANAAKQWRFLGRRMQNAIAMELLLVLMGMILSAKYHMGENLSKEFAFRKVLFPLDVLFVVEESAEIPKLNTEFKENVWCRNDSLCWYFHMCGSGHPVGRTYICPSDIDELSYFDYHTSFCHFVLAPRLLSGDRLQILGDDSNELLTTLKIHIDSQCNDSHPGRCGKF